MNIQEAAEILEQHIRRSGLKAGDRYITAKDAGKLLGKSVMTAQRAMTLLAQRKLLERRPKAGTFIAESAFSGPDLKCGRGAVGSHCEFVFPGDARLLQCIGHPRSH